MHTCLWSPWWWTRNWRRRDFDENKQNQLMSTRTRDTKKSCHKKIFFMWIRFIFSHCFFRIYFLDGLYLIPFHCMTWSDRVVPESILKGVLSLQIRSYFFHPGFFSHCNVCTPHRATSTWAFCWLSPSSLVNLLLLGAKPVSGRSLSLGTLANRLLAKK